jgi:hypothetical protein
MVTIPPCGAMGNRYCWKIFCRMMVLDNHIDACVKAAWLQN